MNAGERNKQFLLLQVNDALFPIGAYSHSYGLETYIQKNLVATEEDAWDFLYRRLRYGFCYNEFLSGRLAFEYAVRGNLKELNRLEELLDASRIPRETREAGHKLGARFVKTISNMPISFSSNIFEQYCANRKGLWVSHSVVYGVFCAAVGIPLEDAMEHYLYAQASSMVTNCVKTIPLSQTGGQKLLCRCQDVFQEILDCLYDLTEEDLCLSAPGFDIRSMQHEGLYSRIYMS
ncbi:MAG: urease accessory protein UreF [Lachnospiraceae bacterium]|nr:urease accessory protein UreF [Lachnospiraceae bacterium]